MGSQIRVRGHLDRSWSAWLAGLTITNRPGGETPLLAGTRVAAAGATAGRAEH
jgi:hypothetical protein